MNIDKDDERQLSPRVNSAHLSRYVGKTIRLPCKVLSADEASLRVEASDGGQVTVSVPTNLQNEGVTDSYIEVVGRVDDSATVQMLSSIGMGANLDLKLVNDTIELMHDPRFFQKMFS